MYKRVLHTNSGNRRETYRKCSLNAYYTVDIGVEGGTGDVGGRRAVAAAVRDAAGGGE